MSGWFPPDVALTTCMSSWKFFSKVVSRDLMVFSMLRESWFTFTITGLSLFFVGDGDAFDPVESLLSSTVADTITVTQDSTRINHMIIDECILKGDLFTNYLPRCQISDQLISVSYCHQVLAIFTLDGAHTKHDTFSCELLSANHVSPHLLFIPRLFNRTNVTWSDIISKFVPVWFCRLFS